MVQSGMPVEEVDIPSTNGYPTQDKNTKYEAQLEKQIVPREQYVKSGFAGILGSPYVLACASFSAMGGLLFGYLQGVVSVILVMEQFLSEFPRVSDTAGGAGFWKGLLTAMIELGALIGAMNQGWIADKISRKYSIMVAVVIFLIGSILQTASDGYAMLVVARLIGGVGIGMLSMVVPLYISEISPPEIRGTLLVLEELAIVGGIVVAFWITYGTRFIPGEWSWRLPFLLQIIPGVVLGCGVLALPFSPRWLISKGRHEEALDSLSKLRQLPPDNALVLREWTEIRAEVMCHQEISAERHPTLHAEPTRLNRIKLELVSWLDASDPGVSSVLTPTLFKTMGLEYDMQLIMSGVLNICQLVGVASSLYTMDRVGRKPLLVWGSVLMSVSHIIIAALVGVFGKDWTHHRNAGWTSVAFLLFYMLAFGATWGPVPWAMPSEIFPSSLRAKGVALSVCSNWFNNFIIGLITPPLVQNTEWGAYLFFAIFCVLSGIWAFFFVRETNGKTLEEVDGVFGDSASDEEADSVRSRIEDILRIRDGDADSRAEGEVGVLQGDKEAE
ncbi:hypothetical protein VE04_08078 [Pseudogymnoascus sp. 24MN13]|nr:hypothetical protein VE04_08078 [Pseudogymnoascus sp. 24MN13]